MVLVSHRDFDKLFKVRPVIDSILKKCRDLPQEERHSIDEQMLPTKERTSLKQYCPKSPTSRESKYLQGVELLEWYMVYVFEVYTGKSEQREAVPLLLMGGMLFVASVRRFHQRRTTKFSLTTTSHLLTCCSISQSRRYGQLPHQTGSTERSTKAIEVREGVEKRGAWLNRLGSRSQQWHYCDKMAR